MHLSAGGDKNGLLYGAYAFAEQMGVLFYLHGDVVPDVNRIIVPTVRPDIRKGESVRW